MTTLATTSTIMPDAADTIGPDDSPDGFIGYRLCEFCVARGVPNDNPSSVCDCQEITRKVAGMDRTHEDGTHSHIPTPIDETLRLAETAVLDHWGAYWDDAVTITKSVLCGQSGDEYTVTIHFDGRLFDDLTEPFTTETGSARIRSFNGDGSLSVGVTLDES